MKIYQRWKSPFCFVVPFSIIVWGPKINIFHESSFYKYAYDITEGRPAALGVKRNTTTCVIAKHAARGANPASHTAGLARPGPRTERLSASAHCQHNTCALRDTRLASLLWRCDPLWRQCIRSIIIIYLYLFFSSFIYLFIYFYYYYYYIYFFFFFFGGCISPNRLADEPNTKLWGRGGVGKTVPKALTNTMVHGHVL